jgi:hypothetical protein
MRFDQRSTGNQLCYLHADPEEKWKQPGKNVALKSILYAREILPFFNFYKESGDPCVFSPAFEEKHKGSCGPLVKAKLKIFALFVNIESMIVLHLNY